MRDEGHVPGAIAERPSPLPALLFTPNPFPSAGKPLNYTRGYNDPAIRWSAAQGVDIGGGLSCHRCVGYYLGQESFVQDTSILVFFEGRERNY